MLTSLEVANVRLFAKRDHGPNKGVWQFDLPRLAVFCGTNSVGKSTLVKVPLLLRQCQGIGEATETIGGQLRLVGSQVDLGTYESFVSNNDLKRDVQLGFSILFSLHPVWSAALRLWKTKPSAAAFFPTVAGDPQSTMHTARVQFSFGLRHPVQTKARKKAAEMHALPIESAERTAFLKRAHVQILDGKEVLLDWTVELRSDPANAPIGAPRYEIRLPTALLQATHWQTMIDVKGNQSETHQQFNTTLRGLLPESIDVKIRPPQHAAKKAVEPQIARWPLPSLVAEVTESLKAAIANVHYVGPLRAPAKRYYVAQSAADPGMDAAGEFLPYVIRDRGNQPVTHILPGESTPVEEPLTVALDRWVHYLRTGLAESSSQGLHEIGIATTKEVLVEFSVRSSVGPKAHALADSGFGYSQVLPVLVRGLLAPTDATLVIEQPEVHLNPALQVRLAEFFVALSRTGRQVIVETHSEHVVNALRVLAAESGDPTSGCSVFFLDASDGQPTVQKLTIEGDGSIDIWPPAFFGEAAMLRGRLLRAQKHHMTPPR